MNSVWILENLTQWQNSIAFSLIRRHPVRVIDSLHLKEEPTEIKKKVRLIIDLDGHNFLNFADLLDDFAVVVLVSEQDLSSFCKSLGPKFWYLDRQNLQDFDMIATTGQPETASQGAYHYKDIVLDTNFFSLKIAAEQQQNLPMKELQILKTFLDHPHECLSRELLQKLVWDSQAVSPRTIDSHVSRLRKKLAKSKVRIENHYGSGYIFG